MSSGRDPLGYYALLGVDPSASIDKIKKAFKAKAQELHPDKNPSADATRQFQFLTEAYRVLGDLHSRSEYDASAYTLDEHADSAEQDQSAVQSIACCVCGKISIQPRYAIYRYVTSFFVVTYRRGNQGVFCAKCGARRAYKNSLITWTSGWWGFPWGPIYSIQAIVRNMLGGEQPPLINFRILAVQATYFASNDRMDLARLIADQALKFLRKIPELEKNQGSAADRDLRAVLTAIQSTASPPIRTLKSSWGIRSSAFRIQAFAASFVSIGLLALLISVAMPNRTAYRHAAPGAAFDQMPPDGGGSNTSEASSVDQFMAQRSAAREAPVNRTPGPPIGQQDTAFNAPIRPLPSTGRMHIIRARTYDVMAPLKVVSFSGSPNYYVKLVDWTTHAPVIYFFIRSGGTLSGEVPLGKYEIHYAAGNTWYGEEYLFGPDTVYSKADDQFVFEREGDKLAGYTIQLKKQLGGNLNEVPISPSEF